MTRPRPPEGAQLEVKTPRGQSLGVDLEEYLGLGLGLAFGAGIALITQGLWDTLASPAREWLTERLLHQKPTRQRVTHHTTLPDVPQGDAVYRVLLSDLHIDTWGELPGRAAAFKSFLAALGQVRGPKRVELYINGDLMDIPLHAAREEGRAEPLVLRINDALSAPWQGVLTRQRGQVIIDELLSALRDVMRDEDPTLHLFYVTGNHDIGISGARYFRPDARRSAAPGGPAQRPILDLPAHAVWNPAVVIETGERWVYIEHGHLHDPLLWLYMRYVLFDLLRGGSLRQERSLTQRLQRTQVGQDHRAGAQNNGQLDRPGLAARLANAVVKLRFRQAARHTFHQLRASTWGRQVRTVIFGHTHLPERFRMGDREYINVGSWAGNKDDQLFWTITPDGTVNGPYQWDG